MQVKIYGGEFAGTPGEIVAAMRDRAWEEGINLEEYIERVARRVWLFGGTKIIIKGENNDERCLSFLNQLSALKIAKMEEMAS